MGVRHWVVASTVFSLACLGDSRGAPSFAVSDSAGVEVLTTAVPPWDTGGAWTVDSVPILRIGLLEGDAPYLFQDITGVLRLGDGRIVVADGLAKEIRFFDAHGVHMRTVGGPGQGPGEFQSLSWMGLCGEGLYVFDRRQRRVSSWSLQGDYKETFQLREPDADRVPYRSSCGADGSILVAGWGHRQRHSSNTTFEMFEQEAPLSLIDPRTQEVVKVGQYISSERVYTTNPVTGGHTTWTHPFGRGVVFTLDREHLYVGTSERLQVEVRDHQGRLLRILRGPDADLTITSEDVAAYRSLTFSRPDSLLRGYLEEQEMPMPPGKPAYTRFLVDRARNLWVKRFVVSEAERERWGVFSPEGRFLGHVAIPEGFHLLDVTDDRVVGVSRDDLGVERVETRRLIRG